MCETHRPLLMFLIMRFLFVCVLSIMLFSGCDTGNSPPEASSPKPSTPSSLSNRFINFESENYNQLWDQAAAAVEETRLWTPAGNNAVEFYLQIHQGFVAETENTEQGKAQKALNKALEEFRPVLSVAIDESLSGGNIQEASRLIRMLAAIDSQSPSLPRQIEHVRRIATGSNTPPLTP